MTHDLFMTSYNYNYLCGTCGTGTYVYIYTFLNSNLSLLTDPDRLCHLGLTEAPLQLSPKKWTIIPVFPVLYFSVPRFHVSNIIFYYVILLLFPEWMENRNTEVVQFLNRDIISIVMILKYVYLNFNYMYETSVV